MEFLKLIASVSIKLNKFLFIASRIKKLVPERFTIYDLFPSGLLVQFTLLLLQFDLVRLDLILIRFFCILCDGFFSCLSRMSSSRPSLIRCHLIPGV